MFAKYISFDGASLAAGLVAGIVLTAMLTSGPLTSIADAGSAVSRLAQVAKYQPAAADLSVQTRRARNDATGGAPVAPTSTDPCPRCR